MSLQSHRVGWGRRNEGYPACIFEALLPLTCADCGRGIEIGERFTRGVRGFRATWPLCLDCRPVEPLGPGEQLTPAGRLRTFGPAAHGYATGISARPAPPASASAHTPH